MRGGDFTFLLFYNFNNEMGKQIAEFKENLFFGEKVAPGFSSDLKVMSSRLVNLTTLSLGRFSP